MGHSTLRRVVMGERALSAPARAADLEQEMESQLQASDYARERGARVYALVSPMVPKAIMSLVSGFMMDLIPNWSEVLALPLAERRDAFANPARL